MVESFVYSIHSSLSTAELQARRKSVWDTLNKGTPRLPDAQPKIIATLQQELRKCSKVCDRTVHRVIADDELWEELNGWEENWMTLFKEVKTDLQKSSSSNQGENTMRQGRWIAAHAYVALLDTTEDDILSSRGASLEHVTEVITEALEVNHGNGEPTNVMPAAQLFVHASTGLYRRCVEQQKEGLLCHPDSIWEKVEGYSERRWRYWAEEWVDIARSENMSVEARTIAARVYEAMEKVSG
ncbi:hypothetical protein K491DRAFT_615115 [Lophiostoma macrostomum CBS 122681]|uniref:Uncharacterized protein n=1 Tax=Lophiostoma macrostomum CBS 122681 TaxID=1314788 RepID=A0A6A6SHS6_9PLEO|nr:hypothetical protein K491DRAFT_615115 [Lophiostoma macrostomum CBS 122681]